MKEQEISEILKDFSKKYRITENIFSVMMSGLKETPVFLKDRGVMMRGCQETFYLFINKDSCKISKLDIESGKSFDTPWFPKEELEKHLTSGTVSEHFRPLYM